KAEEPADAKEPTKHLLYPDGPERAIAVVGLYEYMLAHQQLTAALVLMRPRIVELIEADREGWPHLGKDGKYHQVGGFVQNYKDELHRIAMLIDTIGKEQKRLGDLLKQAKGHTDIVATQTKEAMYAHD